MIKLHGYVDNKLKFQRRQHHCPRVGDTIRYYSNSGESYAKVTEVIWCFDEATSEHDRVNLRLEKEK